MSPSARRARAAGPQAVEGRWAGNGFSTVWRWADGSVTNRSGRPVAPPGFAGAAAAAYVAADYAAPGLTALGPYLVPEPPVTLL